MGKITLEMIAKSPSHTKKRRDETVQQYVRRLTHLYFSEKNIDEIVSKLILQTAREFSRESKLEISHADVCVYRKYTVKQ